MKTSFSISKNNQAHKLNAKLRCPCHLLPLDQAADRVHRLLHPVDTRRRFNVYNTSI